MHFIQQYSSDSSEEETEEEIQQSVTSSVTGNVLDTNADFWNKKLLTAVENGNVKDLTLCLDSGADLEHASEEFGWTALMYAAYHGHSKVVQLLLDRGCEKDATDVSGQTALMVAAMAGELKVARLLLDQGCDIDAKSGKGFTALILAARYGHLEVTQLLLNRGCYRDAKGNDGKTALHYAAEQGKLDVTRYLIEQAGISPLTMTHQHKTPYDLATKKKKVMEYLQTFMPKTDIQMQSTLKVKDNMVPIEIKSMYDKTSVPLYLKLLESGSEKKRDIRLVIVGKKGSGKTSLLKRLFREEISMIKEVTITNGIKIHRMRCNANSNDGVWKRLRSKNKYSELDARLLNPYEETLRSQAKEGIEAAAVQKTIQDITTPTKFTESMEYEVASQQPTVIPESQCKPPVSAESHCQPPGTSESQCKPHVATESQSKHTVATESPCKPPVATESQCKPPVATESQCKPPVATESQCKPPVATESQCKPPVATECQCKPPVATESQCKPPVATESQCKHPVATESQCKPPVATESQCKPDVATESEPNLPLDQAAMEIETMLQSDVILCDKEKYATLLLWDFAGDEEFYHTHQTFLSPDAIYLLVTNLNEAEDKHAQDMFQLWMNSIHCYCRLEEQKNNADSSTAEMHDKITEKGSIDLDPPVVLVGSHKDKVEPSEGEEIEDACKDCLDRYTKDVSDDACGHIRDEYFISNIADDNSIFQAIRQDILNLARKMRTWDIDYPLKFIQLEKRLHIKKEELQIPIISFTDIKEISTETTQPLSEEELILYLKFHHEIRALVYFEDLPGYIILDTQWLSDAFKTIVTPKTFQLNVRRHKRKKLWDDFNERGILHSEVLEDIFEKEQNILYEHKSYILSVMEKFDIIIRPNLSDKDAADEKPQYYVPCMIKAEAECDIYKMFNVTEDTCKRSAWLCFKFRFLPPHLMNHLIASLCREYEVAKVVITEKNRQIITIKAKKRIIMKKESERILALFKGTAVFELQKTTKLSKLLVMTYPNLLQIQILEFGKNVFITRGMYKHIAKFVTDEINKIISTRFRMTNVSFDKRWECGLTKPECVTGSNNFSEEKIAEYYCETCTASHKSNDEWSDLQSQELCLYQNSDEASESYPQTEKNSKKQIISTKVRCHVQGGAIAFSKVSNKSTKTCSFTGFTKEEINSAKMGMIVLNILADALYDLLKQDIPNLTKSRSSCDITYLYSEHRKVNKHIPSSSSHKRYPWGGEWKDIYVTDIAIGDDIERIRLTRNELQHSKEFKIDDIRFKELCDILIDLLKRFDQHIKPARLYTDRFTEILAKIIAEEEVKRVHQRLENEIKLGLTFEFEVEHQLNV